MVKASTSTTTIDDRPPSSSSQTMTQVTQRKNAANKQAAVDDADKLTGPEKFIVPELTVKDMLSVIP